MDGVSPNKRFNVVFTEPKNGEGSLLYQVVTEVNINPGSIFRFIFQFLHDADQAAVSKHTIMISNEAEFVFKVGEGQGTVPHFLVLFYYVFWPVSDSEQGINLQRVHFTSDFEPTR